MLLALSYWLLALALALAIGSLLLILLLALLVGGRPGVTKYQGGGAVLTPLEAILEPFCGLPRPSWGHHEATDQDSGGHSPQK